MTSVRTITSSREIRFLELKQKVISVVSILRAVVTTSVLSYSQESNQCLHFTSPISNGFVLDLFRRFFNRLFRFITALLH